MGYMITYEHDDIQYIHVKLNLSFVLVIDILYSFAVIVAV